MLRAVFQIEAISYDNALATNPRSLPYRAQKVLPLPPLNRRYRSKYLDLLITYLKPWSIHARPTRHVLSCFGQEASGRTGEATTVDAIRACTMYSYIPVPPQNKEASTNVSRILQRCSCCLMPHC